MRDLFIFLGLAGAYSIAYWVIAPSEAQEVQLQELAVEFSEACEGLRGVESFNERAAALEAEFSAKKKGVVFDPISKPWKCSWQGHSLTDPLLM